MKYPFGAVINVATAYTSKLTFRKFLGIENFGVIIKSLGQWKSNASGNYT
jgi:hypothetical protein